MFVIIGYVVILGCVLGGFLMAGGHLGVLMQPVEVLIIVGAAFGAFLASNSMNTVKAAIAGGMGTLKGSTYNKDFYMDLLMSFNALGQKARKEGLLSLEKVVDNPESSSIFADKVAHDHHLMEFICDKLRLILTGVDVNQLEDIMDAEIEVHHEAGHAPIKAVQRIGDGMPAFGIVAAVMGVVHTMESVGIPPAELGKLIAAALVGTFLGILLAYGFIAPVSAVMEDRLEEEANAYKCAQKGLLNCAKGASPAMTVEFMRTIIPHHLRPSFSDVEAQLKGGK
ncbi:MAG: flagellar motor stator protein MotA [Methylomonas sp.]|nr:flagellar motor stator protein MotA [Methylomonas sp.]PPD22371.1 MAG: flagellar motor stator protein MotA [Methylomonas sp.]PPD26875.1 MAG: flagellar motor stator protein MotA [Methylomonas sp.]PPD37670.1 MAG: flagellar motor stator protein MotA [Methylomonas sp.]PPD38783.1 MAG: flagellar motor stator protein MotA [Methylomonas sp.]